MYKVILKPTWVYGVQLVGSLTQIQKYYKDFKTSTSQNASWYVTNDTLHHNLNVPCVRNEIKRLSQRYADRMEERFNIFATNLMKEVKTTRRLKRRLAQDSCI